MPLFKTEAIVIRSSHYGESDRIVTFLTRDFGKIRGIAKGARRSRKRFPNALGLFSHLRLIFFERGGLGLVRAEGGDLLHPFPKIRESLKKICYGTYYLELIDEIAGEREANPEAFDLLLSFLLDLEERDPGEEALRMFEIRMLSLFGYRPNLKGCDICKAERNHLQGRTPLFFSVEKGAMICERCSRRFTRLIPLTAGTARLIEQISEVDLTRLPRLRFTPQALAESRELLTKFITYQLGKEMKSTKILEAISPKP